ncbi:MAG: helicase [Chloroflexota bacterium]|nr:MAG: helicase [Chloroflexota bacterium]
MQITLHQYRDLLLTYLRPQRRRVAALAALLFSSIGLQLLNPQIVRYFIDTVTAVPAPPSLTAAYALRFPEYALPDPVAGSLLAAALLFIGAALLQQVVAVGAVYVGENVGWTATNALRADLALHCLRLDMGFHHVRTPGEMIERIDGDVTELANFFSQFVILVIGNIVLLLGVVLLLLREDLRVGLVMAVFALATLWALNRVRSIAVPQWTAARESSAALYGFLEEQLSGTEDTRSSGAVAYTMRHLYRLMRDRLQTERRAARMNLVVFVVVAASVTVGTAIAFAAGYLLFRGGLATIGTVFIIVSYTNMMFRPMRELTNQIQELQKAGAGVGRITALYHQQSSIQDGPGAPLSAGPLAVDFDHVTFAYYQDDVVLADLAFRLEPGRVLGLLGRTGSGKTTISRLLFRLYDVPAGAGAVRLGGVDIRQAHLRELRQRVGIVTQDVQLFRASVRDNLTFFDRRIPDERIVEALGDLGLLEWFTSLPQGLDTEIQSGGSGLSAGEAQLLAFTRVFLKDPGLVILDEASSRLDPVTEQRIERAIDKLLRDRTAIIIAHRLATVQRADEIMILENGRIREHGARARLAGDPGSRFYQLLQTGLEEALA